jgi:hypothetical protein
VPIVGVAAASALSRATGSLATLFHAIDSRPVWWTGPEAGDWSPTSAVERDCASGLVSSLVISLVVRRSTGWGHTGGQSGFDCSCWSTTATLS